jgi:hypothetical protein
MQVQTRARIEIPLLPERAFDLAVADETFPRTLRGYGPIPGLARVETVGGAPVAGATRRVSMTDDSVIVEELLEHERPRRHRYRWLEPPAPPFSLLVRSAEGDWKFSPAGAGTSIEWTYRFELTSPLVLPLAAPVVWLFRRWMERGLARLRDLAAAAASGEPAASAGRA